MKLEEINRITLLILMIFSIYSLYLYNKTTDIQIKINEVKLDNEKIETKIKEKELEFMTLTNKKLG